MLSLGRALTDRLLPLLLLSVVAGCTADSTEDTSSASESNLDEGETAPPEGPLTPDATFGSGGLLALSGPNVAISAAKRADGSIAVLGGRGASASLTIVKADGSAQVDTALVPDHSVSGIVVPHRDGLVVAGVVNLDAEHARYFVSRVGADGAVDPTFTPDPLELRPAVGAAAVTKDGKIVIAGTFENHAAIVRLDAKGSLDPSFADHGVWLASDDRAVVTRIALGKDDSIYAVTHGGDKTRLSHLSVSGKADAKFGTEGVAELPLNSGLSSRSALVMAPDGLRYIGPSADAQDPRVHSFPVDARGAVGASEPLTGKIIGFGMMGAISAVTEGDACTVHVAKATTGLSADECSRSMSYVSLGGQKRAIVYNTNTDGISGVTLRVFGH